MTSKDQARQEAMKKYYNESSYYENTKHNKAEKRSRFNQYTIKNVLGIYSPKKKEEIIDFGCGWGNISLTLQKKGFNVTGIDYSKKSIRICKVSAKKLGLNQKRFLCRDATDTKLKPNSVDVAYCADLAEHLYPDVYTAFLKEAHRVLKKGGRLVIYTPNPVHFLEILKNNNIILREDPAHVDYKNMARLKKSLSDHGFKVTKAYHIESHLPLLRTIEKMLMKHIPFLRRRNAILAIKN